MLNKFFSLSTLIALVIFAGPSCAQIQIPNGGVAVILDQDGNVSSVVNEQKQNFERCVLCTDELIRRYELGPHCEKSEDRMLKLPICKGLTQATVNDIQGIAVIKSRVNPTCISIGPINGKYLFASIGC